MGSGSTGRTDRRPLAIGSRAGHNRCRDPDSNPMVLPMPKTTASRREETKYRIFPPLDPETYHALKANIALNGVLVPVVRDEEGNIMDGFARAQIAGELGYQFPSVVQEGLSEQEKRSLVRALNMARRQLDQAGKRAIIAEQLRETPGRSNRWIAKSLGVNHETVAAVRRSMEATGGIRQLDRTQGADGKVRPARFASSLPAPEEPGDGLDIDEEVYASRNKSFYRSRDPTSPRASNQETPPGVARFLRDVISAKYEVETILDPCAGGGALTRPWKRRKVIAFEIARGRDFFAGPNRIDCDLVLCNPPFQQDPESPSVYRPEQFLRRILEVVSPKTPVAMIVPMGMRLNQSTGSKRWRWLRDEVPQITGIVSLPRDIFGGVDFHCEILLLNLPRLRPHYFLSEDYLRG